MTPGIFAKTFDGATPDAVLARAASAGFACVQYNMGCSGLASMPNEISDAAVSAIASASRVAGVGIAALSGTFNMIHPDIKVRKDGLRRLEILARIARHLPTRLITLCTGTRDPEDQWRAHRDNGSQEAWRDLRTSMDEALEIAERHDLALGVEPELANVVSNADAAFRLIRETGSERLKIVLDPANLFEIDPPERRREIISAAIEKLGDRIAMGHAKDRSASGAFVAPGKGVIDFDHYVSCLKSAGFNGSIVAHGFPATDAAGVAKFLHATLIECGAADSSP